MGHWQNCFFNFSSLKKKTPTNFRMCKWVSDRKRVAKTKTPQKGKMGYRNVSSIYNKNNPQANMRN